MFIKLFLIIFLFSSSWSFASETVQESSPWYKLFNNEEYVVDFTLNAGDSKAVTIYSNKEIMVGFKSDASSQEFEEYVHKNMLAPVESNKAPLELTSQIEQEAKGETSASVYGFGGGTTFKPGNGRIVLSMVNHSNKNYKIVIYKKSK